MTKLLIRLFVRDREQVGREDVRDAYGRLAGFVGIVSNLLLFALKLMVGMASNSISITADAINNLSDCASSLITLLGFRLSRIPADDEHPYGHARFEYISGLVVSILILVIGLEFLMSSVSKILHPDLVEFSGGLVAVLLLSIAVKLWQSMFNRSVGRTIRSTVLTATAADSRNDVLTTAAVLAGAVAAHLTGLSLDGWMGLGVAVFILISGVNMIRETLNPLLGTAPDLELVQRIQRKILGYESILGTHDLMVHNYGPGRCFASVHVEVPANQDILISHDIIDNIERDFSLQEDIQLVIHLDPVVTDDARVNELRGVVEGIAREIDPVITIHDFRMVEGRSHTNLIFDAVLPPRYRLSDGELRKQFLERARRRDPGFYCVVTVDRSYTSTRPGRER